MGKFTKYKALAIILLSIVIVINWMLISSSWEIVREKTQKRNMLLKDIIVRNKPTFSNEKYSRSSSNLFLSLSKLRTVESDGTTRQGRDEMSELAFPSDRDLYNSDLATFWLDGYRVLSTQIPDYGTSEDDIPANKHHAMVWSTYSENRLPMNPKLAENMFSQFIPWWEMVEMKAYSEIWYMGIGFGKPMFTANETTNFGFAYTRKGKRGKFYKVHYGDHLAYRYKILSTIGKGTYGTVVHALDVKTGQDVAIKIFCTNTGTWKADRYAREANMIAKISHNAEDAKYFPTYNGSFIFRNHICVVQELLGRNFQYVIKKRPPLGKIQMYAKDMIESLAALHRLNVLHMDLKMTNFAFGREKNENGKQPLKLLDFGLSCIKGSKDFECFSDDRVQTPDYECPEVTLNLPYDKPCDVFDIGIILLTAVTGKRYFRPKRGLEPSDVMYALLGPIPYHMMKKSDLEDGINHVYQIDSELAPLKTIVESLPPDLADLIIKFLILNPVDRITAEEARFHPFLKAVY